MTYNDVAINKTVNSWNIKKLKIDRLARHKD